MPVPTFDQLLRPTIDALHDLGGSASIQELLEQVIRDLKLSQEVIEQPHPGRETQTELEYRLAWARTYLKKYGLITNSKWGVWALTPKGSEAKDVEPQDVVRFVRELFARKRRERAEVVSTEDEEPDIEEADEETASWRATLLATLLEMPPDAFERLCQRLLRETGFIRVEVTGRSGDGGLDGHGLVQLAGLLSFPVVFQCKRYHGNVDPRAIRDFRGAMIGRADRGIIITTGGFTAEARREARRDGAPPVDLIDGKELIDKLKELRLGIRTRNVELIEVDTKWFASI